MVRLLRVYGPTGQKPFAWGGRVSRAGCRCAVEDAGELIFDQGFGGVSVGAPVRVGVRVGVGVAVTGRGVGVMV